MSCWAAARDPAAASKTAEQWLLTAPRGSPGWRPERCPAAPHRWDFSGAPLHRGSPVPRTCRRAGGQALQLCAGAGGFPGCPAAIRWLRHNLTPSPASTPDAAPSLSLTSSHFWLLERQTACRETRGGPTPANPARGSRSASAHVGRHREDEANAGWQGCAAGRAGDPARAEPAGCGRSRDGWHTAKLTVLLT